MSTTPEEAEIEEGMDNLFREWEAEHAENFREKGKQNFEIERVTSYFRSSEFDPKVCERMDESKAIKDISASASLILSFSCVEIALKRELLTPFIFAFTINDNIAGFFANYIVRNEMPPKHLGKLIEAFLSKQINLDTKHVEIAGLKKTLWAHINDLREIRNKVVHSTHFATIPQANRAEELAQFVVNQVCLPLRSKIRKMT